MITNVILLITHCTKWMQRKHEKFWPINLLGEGILKSKFVKVRKLITISKEYVSLYLKYFIQILILSSFTCAEHNMPKIFLNCGELYNLPFKSFLSVQFSSNNCIYKVYKYHHYFQHFITPNRKSITIKKKISIPISLVNSNFFS